MICQNSDVKCFEVDMPKLNVKKDALIKSGIKSTHVTFVETDFNQGIGWTTPGQRI